MNFPTYINSDLRLQRMYRIFYNMHSRCYNPAVPAYQDYGKKGIVVEGGWNLPGREGFEAFVKDMGIFPDFSYSLDRRDPAGNYSKDNCRWATPSEQALNKRPRGYVFSSVISFDKAKNKYKLYKLNLDTKVKKYIGLFESMEAAQTFYTSQLALGDQACK